ncbi:glycosyltransferase family 32 protein [Thermoanaerobacterium thermosaccharolyticum]|uniref:glycosyltransferase family 32 protein n=1 Tax=Thermoanaerobacterium thermosaccharolyticum TaxID=1517 RepID=UPI0020A44354|nr:glycosyltransferase [Thermoanaerobacterium thermosaccharolyticum]MCP2241252.1 mannosyltransferase OCH1-like enzyme [Thermoanaerobacterium thermosaccharolyticum]
MQNKIPKVIHYCWFGKNTMPKLNQRCIESWKRVLPDYELKLWNENNFDVNINQFVKEAYEMKKWAFVTDYVRLYVLYNYGGIYMDTDVEVLKRLDSFLIHSAFSGFESNEYIPTGIIGAERGNKWIGYLLDYYKDKRFILENGLNTITNVKIITELSKELGLKANNKYQILEYDVHIYPKEYFCPLSFDNLQKNFTKNTYTIHHYSGSWLDNKTRIKMKVKKLLSLFNL